MFEALRVLYALLIITLLFAGGFGAVGLGVRMYHIAAGG